MQNVIFKIVLHEKSCIEANTLLILNVKVNEKRELIIHHFSKEEP